MFCCEQVAAGGYVKSSRDIHRQVAINALPLLSCVTTMAPMKKSAQSDSSRGAVRDNGARDATANRIKIGLAQQIIRVLDERELTVRSAAEITGTSAADFSRIRQTKLNRFTVDRLLNILNRLGQDVDFAVSVRPRVTRSKLSSR